VPKRDPMTAKPENPPAWADATHPSNKLRPRVRCAGCGAKGCVTYWGPWCFPCNVKRMTHLCGRFDALEKSLTERTKPDGK